MRWRRPRSRSSSDATVFDIDAGLNVAWLASGAAREISARHLILATGAMERATPVPGWTLPGVMYAGAAQLLLKTAASVPSGRVVLAGNGPLLLLVANQLADAGANVVALVETTRFADMLGAAPHLPRALRAGGTLLKGLAMMRALRRRRLRWIRGATGLEILGAERAEALRVDRRRARRDHRRRHRAAALRRDPEHPDHAAAAARARLRRRAVRVASAHRPLWPQLASGR